MATYKMVDSEKLDADLTTVADAIRAKTGGDEPLSFPEGMAGEVDAVFEAGKKAEYDAFWDVFQNYGKKRNYPYGFYNWQEGTLKPKYDIYLSEAGAANFTFAYVRQAILDFKIIVDLNYATSKTISSLFVSSSIKQIKYIEFQNEDIVIRDDVFNGCSQLEVLNIYGIIGSDINIKDSIKLNKKSIEMLVNCLSGNQTEKTVTLSKTAVNTAFETSAGAADGSTSEEWTTLIATKPNWTIALV